MNLVRIIVGIAIHVIPRRRPCFCALTLHIYANQKNITSADNKCPYEICSFLAYSLSAFRIVIVYF